MSPALTESVRHCLGAHKYQPVESAATAFTTKIFNAVRISKSFQVRLLAGQGIVFSTFVTWTGALVSSLAA